MITADTISVYGSLALLTTLISPEVSAIMRVSHIGIVEICGEMVSRSDEELSPLKQSATMFFTNTALLLLCCLTSDPSVVL